MEMEVVEVGVELEVVEVGPEVEVGVDVGVDVHVHVRVEGGGRGRGRGFLDSVGASARTEGSILRVRTNRCVRDWLPCARVSMRRVCMGEGEEGGEGGGGSNPTCSLVKNSFPTL